MEDFYTVFEKYIKGQTIIGIRSVAPFGNKEIKDVQFRYYGDGVILSNGYMLLSYGGGCSGEDCNTTFIVNDKGDLISTNNW